MGEQQSKDRRNAPWDPRLNTGVPHVARVYDYWLNGKDNFAADRLAGEETIAAFPGIKLAYLDADLEDTDKILEQAATTLDFSRPVGVVLLAILHYVPDLAEVRRIVARLMGAVPAGSFLVISHAGTDLLPKDVAAFEESLNAHLPEEHRHVARPRDVVTGFFDGLRLVEPGLVRVSDWRPDSPEEADTPTILWGGVARKS